MSHKQEAYELVLKLKLDLAGLMEDVPDETAVLGKVISKEDRDWYMALQELETKADELFKEVFL